ncbi:MAG: VWA domain-containing protein, partial [Nitrospirales bacterium]|nr:VWA domain-containing protein [Nitrospirales bacterium]
ASKDRGGRYLRAALRGERDIALDATLRAAAPFQGLRKRDGRLVIHQEDLRYKEREKRMCHLVVFVVDGSGSMGARKRMAETKGAIQSMLMDCYQKRDRVSLIVFRKDRAEVVLPPTASVELASRRLAEIPVGGKTPITAGLLEAYHLVKKTMLRNPETRPLVVLITDGRANHGMTEMPIREEMQKVSSLFAGLQGTDFVVVDTEEKKGFLKTDLALQIAQWLDADYYPVDALRSEFLAGIIKEKKSEKMLQTW